MIGTVDNNGLPKGWHLARFDEFLKRVDRKIVIDDSSPYNCVGVRWYGNGTFVREKLLGMDISRKQQWVIKEGDIVYNKLFAWKGAFAIADNSVSGCIVSDKFPTYEADLSIINLRYLKYYFHSPQLAQQAQSLSKGAAAISKLTLNPPQFWELTIPLPTLKEQERIVARIEKLAIRIEEARKLRQQAIEKLQVFVTSFLNQVFHEGSLGGHLGDVLLGKPRNGWSARCNNAEGGVPVLSLGAVTGFNYREREFKRTSEPTLAEAHYWLRNGDLLLTRSNSPELVGHAAIYNGSPSPCIYPDLMMRLEVDEQRADKRFVLYLLRSGAVRDFIRRKAKGTSPTMKKISQGIVMDIPFPTQIPITEQQRIVTYLDKLQSKLDIFKRLQVETAAELDALLPSILNRAFKGEL